ncbi:MAG: hypothetical protein IJB70_07765 [Clostridia bacterium]|nr:hypothetical protein [Clostridia bacterium]
MKKTKIFSIITALVLTVFVSTNVYAYHDVIEFETFESYGNKISGSWRAQGRETTAPIVETERGSAVKLVSDSEKMLEVFQDFSKTSDEETSFMFVFSAKYGGSDCSRGLYTRTDSKEYPLMYIDSDIDRIRLGNMHYKYEIKNDVWYDFQVEYNAATGYTRCSIFSEGKETIIEGTQGFSELSGFWRVNFPAFLTSEGESQTYLTDVGVYALDYDVVPFTQYVSRGEKFEDFSHAENGLTAPDGWSLKNTHEGSTALYCKEIEGSQYGKSLVMYWDGQVSKTYELLKENLDLDSQSTVVFDLMRDEGSEASIQIRGTTSAGKYINYASVAYVDADGTVKVGNKPVFTMESSKWYNFSFCFDCENGSYYLKVNDGESAYESEMTSIPRSIVDIDVIGVRFIADKMTETCFYIDNCYYDSGEISDEDIRISGFKTGIRGISPLGSSVQIALSGDFDSSFVEKNNVVATVNGSADNVSVVTISGNTLTVEMKEFFEPGKTYMVEVTDDYGLGISRLFICSNLLELSSFTYDKSSIEPGDLQCVISLASYTDEYDSCFVLSVLRNKADNSIVQTSFVTLDLSPEIQEAVLNLNVPDDGEYTAETFVWKSVFNMQSLFPSKVIE